MIRNIRKESGFTLLEMLLTVVVLGGALLLITRTLEESARAEFYKANASYMQHVMDVALDYIEGASGFNAVYTLATNNGGVVEVPVRNIGANNGANGANPTNFYLESGAPALGIAPSALIIDATTVSATEGFNETSPLGPQVTVLYHVMDSAAAGVVSDRTLGVSVATLGFVAERDLRAAAQAIGAGARYISINNAGAATAPCLPIGCAGSIQDAFSPSVDAVADFVGTRWGNLAAGTQASIANGGYLMVQQFVSESDIAGDYLYRTPQLGNPELNQMQVDLDMANNNIVGVDNINVPGNITVSSDLHAQGSVFSSGNLVATGGDIVIRGDTQAGSVAISPFYAADPNVNPGTQSVNIQNNLNTGSLQVTNDVDIDNAGAGSVTVGGNIAAPLVQAGTLNVTTMDATASSGVFSTNYTGNSDLAVTNTVRAGELQTDTINIGGSVGAIEVLVQPGGNVAADTVQTNIINLDGPADIQLLEDCLSGC